MSEKLLCNVQVIQRGLRGTKGAYTVFLLMSKNGILLSQNVFPGHLNEAQVIDAYLRGVDSLFPARPF